VNTSAEREAYRGEKYEEGIGLCLSGGGFRAMLFHTGALIRLNELGILSRLDRICSVSGGSIVAGILAMTWSALGFEQGVATNLKDAVVERVRDVASRTIDVPAVVRALWPGRAAGNELAGIYRGTIFGNQTLADLPDEPRFIFMATNLTTGVSWRFSKPYTGDYRVGLIDNAAFDLAIAVAASSAFPPVLSPLLLDLDPSRFRNGPAEYAALRRRAVLTDGGVYDNLGLEPVFKRLSTLLVSDGGASFPTSTAGGRNWFTQAFRVLFTIDNQVRSLRKRQLLEFLQSRERAGCYWGISTRIDDYGIPDSIPVPPVTIDALAGVGTRLKRLERPLQSQLINWGYAVADAAIRRYFDPAASAPTQLPYPEAPLR
jgi:NTE family protein